MNCPILVSLCHLCSMSHTCPVWDCTSIILLTILYLYTPVRLKPFVVVSTLQLFVFGCFIVSLYTNCTVKCAHWQTDYRNYKPVVHKHVPFMTLFRVHFLHRMWQKMHCLFQVQPMADRHHNVGTSHPLFHNPQHPTVLGKEIKSTTEPLREINSLPDGRIHLKKILSLAIILSGNYN